MQTRPEQAAAAVGRRRIISLPPSSPYSSTPPTFSKFVRQARQETSIAFREHDSRPLERISTRDYRHWEIKMEQSRTRGRESERSHPSHHLRLIFDRMERDELWQKAPLPPFRLLENVDAHARGGRETSHLAFERKEGGKEGFHLSFPSLFVISLCFTTFNVYARPADPPPPPPPPSSFILIDQALPRTSPPCPKINPDLFTIPSVQKVNTGANIPLSLSQRRRRRNCIIRLTLFAG